MEFVYNALVVLHLIGMAAIVGGWLAVIKAPRIVPAMVHGALTQLVTGLILVGMLESGVVEHDEPINHAKIGVKLVIAIAVAVLAWTNRKREDVPVGVVHAIGGLAILNVCVAVFWH